MTSKQHDAVHIAALALAVAVLLFAVVDLSQPIEKNDYVSVQVTQGDSLYRIAQEYHRANESMSIGEFVSWVQEVNGIHDPDHIKIGDQLYIPVKKDRATYYYANQ